MARFSTSVLLLYIHYYFLACAAVFGDMVEVQIPGVYNLVPLDSASGTCASKLKVGLLEVMGTAAKQLFVVPHSAISVSGYSISANTTFVACTGLTMEANSITRNSSAMVLRRSRDLAGRIDMRVPLLKNLELLRENYFVGYEHGDRLCNGYSKVRNTGVSVWFAPGTKFSAVYNDLLLNFLTDDKYIFYFSSPPCFYKADSKVVGDVNIIRPVQGTIIPPNGKTSSTSDVAIKGANGSAETTNTPEVATRPRGPACFPGNVRVKVRRKKYRFATPGTDTTTTIIAMSELEIGAEPVFVSDGIDGDKWTRVIAMTHSDAEVRSVMVGIELEMERDAEMDAAYTTHNGTRRRGRRRLTLSGDHLVPVVSRYGYGYGYGYRYRYRRASELAVGDTLADRTGKSRKQRSVITAVNKKVEARGLYAPVTRSGTMRVNDVYVSCYAINWRIGHALLAPLRMGAEYLWEIALLEPLRLARATYFNT